VFKKAQFIWYLLAKSIKEDILEQHNGFQNGRELLGKGDLDSIRKGMRVEFGI